MESRFLTKREAAQVLGVHLATVFRMIARGDLRAVTQARFVGVLEEDVIALRYSNQQEGQLVVPLAVNCQTISRHETELRVLRRELDQVLRVLNVRADPLEVSDLQMACLYKTAIEYAERGWPPQAEEGWAEYFLRFGTNNFCQIEKMIRDAHPWRPFLKLATTMMLRPYSAELSQELSAGRDHVELMASLWLELKGISPRRLGRLLYKARPSKRLITSLDRRQKKFSVIV